MRALNYLPVLWQKPCVIPRALAAWCAINLRGQPVLRGAEFAVTYRCQAFCSKCSITNLTEPHRRELTLPQIETIARQISALGAILINITGGEPLLRLDILDIVAVLGKMPVIVSLATNALLLDKSLCLRLRQAGLQILQFSMVSPLAAEHDRELGVPGSFTQTLAQIDNARRSGITVLLNIVVTRELLHSSRLQQAVDLARQRGCFLSLILPAPVGGWEGKDVMLTPADYQALRQWLRYPFVTTDTETCYKRGRCPAGNEKIYISAYGDLYACPFIQQKQGNILEQGLSALWHRQQQRYSRCVNIKQ